MDTPLVLASASRFRKQLLDNAGLSVETVPANIDERAAEAPMAEGGASPSDIALVLAEAKAQTVSETCPNAVVIGCDQTLSLGDEVFHKPRDMDGARQHLLRLSGHTHHLNSAVVLAQYGQTLWRHVAIASLTMRVLDPGFVGRYLAKTGNAALESVGAYQVEGLGIQLFEDIEGDYFTIIGLPLLPLLAELRSRGLIDG